MTGSLMHEPVGIRVRVNRRHVGLYRTRAEAWRAVEEEGERVYLCERCGGQGERWPGEQCRACGGTGEIHE